MKFSDILKGLRKEYGMTQVELAKKLGLTRSSLSMYELGDREPDFETLEAIADYFNVDMDYLLGRSTKTTKLSAAEDEEPAVPIHPDIKDIKKYRTPMLGDVACGTPIVANPEYETYIETDFNPKANHCVRARGDSMIGARIYDGDIVFIKDCDMVDNGDIAVVIIDGEVTLKRFYYYREENVVKLIAENPNYAPLVYSGEEINHIKIVGKALFFQGFIK